MILIDLAPVLFALALLFIPLLSEGPPGLPRRRKMPEAQIGGAVPTHQGCHLRGLPPRLTQLPHAEHR
jgi:hypothetical protein